MSTSIAGSPGSTRSPYATATTPRRRRRRAHGPKTAKPEASAGPDPSPERRAAGGVLDRRKSSLYNPALANPLSRRDGAQVAQLVEHVTENHGVGGSIPPLGTNKINSLADILGCSSGRR